MNPSKEKKPVETPARDSKFDVTYNPMDRLSLPAELKEHLKAAGLDYRFLNSAEFRASGNYHRSQWQPFDAREAGIKLQGLTGEGLIQRGDLILGVRPKSLTAQYKAMKDKRNRVLSNFNQTEAKRMREQVRDKGLSEHVKVEEGYGED